MLLQLHAFLTSLLLLGLLMVLFQTHVPGEAAHGRHTLELVNYVARDKVDVIIVELDTSVADSLSPQLIEFSIIHPLHTLERERE